MRQTLIIQKSLLGLMTMAIAVVPCCTACCQIPTSSGGYTLLKPRLSHEDIQFGKQQLEQLVKDRPEISKILIKEDQMWMWAVRQFAGEGGNQKIYWNSGELKDKGFEFSADCSYPVPGRAGFIRLRKLDRMGKPICAEELLSGLVFECNNTRSGQAFDKVFQSAIDGKISKEEWVEENTKIEYRAILRTKDFYTNIFLPIARARNYTPSKDHWGTDGASTYETWRARFKDHSGYPWSYWGRYYEENVEPYLTNRQTN